MSLKDQIETAEKTLVERVEVPEWGISVELHPMTIKTRSAIYGLSVGEDESVSVEKFYPLVLIACVFDAETGEAAFTNDDHEWLANRAAGPVEHLAQQALTLSGLTKANGEEAKKDS